MTDMTTVIVTTVTATTAIIDGATMTDMITVIATTLMMMCDDVNDGEEYSDEFDSDDRHRISGRKCRYDHYTGR